MTRRLRDVGELLAPAVTAALAKLDLSDEDKAAARLAERYAATIDEAQRIAADLYEAQFQAIDAGEADLHERLRALAAKVKAQTVLADLGPKLLAALEALGATPRARAAVAKGGDSRANGGGLARLRSARSS